MLLIMCQKKKKGKDNKDIEHKWYKLGISGEICDKSKNCQKNSY